MGAEGLAAPLHHVLQRLRHSVAAQRGPQHSATRRASLSYAWTAAPLPAATPGGCRLGGCQAAVAATQWCTLHRGEWGADPSKGRKGSSPAVRGRPHATDTHPEAGLQALPALGVVTHLPRAGRLHAVRALQQALQEVGAAGAAAVLDLCAWERGWGPGGWRKEPCRAQQPAPLTEEPPARGRLAQPTRLHASTAPLPPTAWEPPSRT